ncbi:CRISPR-associated protein Csx20 [Thermodesulforhabdus norvegica]|uniref:CRISPR-associated protein, TM1812 family n=1 Tax=Thermodesulforhabdus norvegica TaxID=39841 RepID=A0A1I4TBD8_9BACT|nr:CRISPR-associated protein Csx20 [Thermodesulforhabdus norvegica]SFM74032.1 CRISPR-associated protein, TM1812 family [Thermodesulforhabdus norvegica]
MARVFVSTLGTGRYVPCHYVMGDRKSELVVFVQEALVDFLCSRWSESDRIVVFCTNKAEEINWKGDEGLGNKLFKRGYPPRIEMVSIPDGRSEDEIMKIFLKVMEALNTGDQIFLDVTHSFRSIPLLMTVAMNYGKIAKGISLGGIYYGALEALGTAQEVEKMPEEERNIPVFDLTPYDSILEWARAVEMFKKAGYAGDLAGLLNRDLGLLFRDRNRLDGEDVLRRFSSLKNSLEGFAESLATARGPEIWNFRPFSELIDQLEDSDLIPPMKPLFELLKKSLACFETGDPMERTFQAAAWCIDHLMIPQAYIFLREGILTGLCESAGQDPCDKETREEFWGGILHVVAQNIPPDDWDGALRQRKREALQIISRGGRHLKKLADEFQSLKKYRNDYLHGGWRKDRRSSKALMIHVRRCAESLRNRWLEGFEAWRRPSKKAFVILSHELTEDQKEELLKIWGVSRIVLMPDEIRRNWEDISPEGESVEDEVATVMEWLEAESYPGDVVVVQGEYGATLHVAIRARELGLVPVYSTTRRELKESKLPDGSVHQERIFRHVRFRKFLPGSGNDRW